jgi:trigger factor
MDFNNVDLSTFIQLGQYKGLDVKVKQTEVTEELVKMQIDILLAQNGEYTKIREDVVVENGTILSFSYKGYYDKDGVKGDPLSNATGTDQLACINGKTLLTISSSGTGGFIDGFAEGMVGKKPGDKFDINVTFPTNYSVQELAGEKAIFEIEIKYVAQTNFSDAWVKEYTSNTYNNYEELYNYIEKSMNDEIKSTNLNVLWDEILKNTTLVEVPEQQYNYIYTLLVANIEEYVLYSWYYWGQQLDFVQVLDRFGFKTLEEFDEYAKEYAVEIIKADLVVSAIIQAEGLEITDEEYELFLAELIEVTGKTREEVITQYGGEDSIKETLLFDEVDKLVVKENNYVVAE